MHINFPVYKYQNGYKRLIWLCCISTFQGVTSGFHQQHSHQNIGRSKTKIIENEKYSKPKSSNREAKSSTEDIDHVQYKERNLVFQTILNLTIGNFSDKKYEKFVGKFVSDKSDDQACDYPRGPLVHQQRLST